MAVEQTNHFYLNKEQEHQRYLNRLDNSLYNTSKGRLIERTKDGDVILDLGCGRGTLLFELYGQNPNATYVGVDLNEEFLKEAYITLNINYKNTLNSPHIYFERDTIQDYLSKKCHEENREKFDTIIFSSSLHELFPLNMKRVDIIKEVERILGMCYDILNDGGKIIIRDGLLLNKRLCREMNLTEVLEEEYPVVLMQCYNEEEKKELFNDLLKYIENNEHYKYLPWAKAVRQDLAVNAAIAKNFLGARTWGRESFNNREMYECHFLLSYCDWEKIVWNTCKTSGDNVKIETFSDDYVRYIGELVVMNDSMLELWEDNTILITIKKGVEEDGENNN